MARLGEEGQGAAWPGAAGRGKARALQKKWVRAVAVAAPVDSLGGGANR